MESLSEHSKNLLKNHLAQTLSRREVEVVVLVLEGKTNRDVANTLCVAEKTIKFHLTNIYKKLNISRRSQIIWTLPIADFIDRGSRAKKAGAAGRVSLKGGSAGSGASPVRRSPSRASSYVDRIPAGCATVEDVAADQEK